MYTGQDFLLEIRQGATQYQTEFLNPALAQYIADQALMQLVEQACREYPQQRSIDKIFGLIRANVSYPVYQNRLVLLPGISVSSITITTVGPPGVYTVNFSSPHFLGPLVVATISGVLGSTNANGNFSYSPGPFLFPGQYAILSPTSIRISTGTAATAYVSGGTLTIPNMVPDYYHLLITKPSFYGDAYDIIDVNNSRPATIKINKNANFRNGEKVYVDGINGPTNVNGVRYVKPLPQRRLVLYTDPNLTQSINPNANYISDGYVARIYENETRPYISDDKISIYKPNVRNPRTLQHDTLLEFYPQEYQCYQAEIDYVRTPQRFIVTDKVINLELFYNRDFISLMRDTAVKSFDTVTTDQSQYQLLMSQIQQNNR